MFNVGPSPQFMNRQGGIPARNGGMKPQPMPIRKPMMSGPMPPMGPINNGPSIGMPMPPLNPNQGLKLAPPTDPMMGGPQPGMMYPGGSPTFNERGPAQPPQSPIRMPIGIVSSSPNEGVAQPWGMRFGGTPSNIGGPEAPPDATPLWQRYAMLNRGM